MIVSSVSTTKTVQAAGPSCDDVLNSCGLTLKAKQRELDLADLGIKIRDDDRAVLQKENADLRSADSAWYRNPFLWATIGLFVGSRIAK